MGFFLIFCCFQKHSRVSQVRSPCFEFLRADFSAKFGDQDETPSDSDRIGRVCDGESRSLLAATNPLPAAVGNDPDCPWLGESGAELLARCTVRNFSHFFFVVVVHSLLLKRMSRRPLPCLPNSCRRCPRQCHRLLPRLVPSLLYPRSLNQIPL